MYHFLSGYSAKVAGTERGVTEPQATFSTCFGGPCMVLSPTVYANPRGDKISRHRVKVWLANTGWTCGPYGVGKRIPIAYTRAIVHAALDGSLDDVPKQIGRVFGPAAPETSSGVPPELLNPRITWADKAAYDEQARQLAAMFADNLKSFIDKVAPEVRAAGPKLRRYMQRLYHLETCPHKPHSGCGMKESHDDRCLAGSINAPGRPENRQIRRRFDSFDTWHPLW